MWAFRLLLLLCFSLPGLAQDWPARPVKFVSPFPPGGSNDTLARLFSARLTDSLKQQFIVENRAGAAGIIGTDYAAKSAPDGYTFVVVFDTHAVHQALNPKLSFDPMKDFAPVMLIGTAPMVITTGAMKPYKTFADVLAAAKAKPDTITVGNVGNGSLAHLATIVLNQTAGIRPVPVPYKGGGPMSTDLLGGQIDLGMASTVSQAQYVRSGRMRALALTGGKPSRSMPDTPTLKEQGIDVVAYAWWAILAPARAPRPVIDKLHAELVKAMRLPDVDRMLTETLGMDVAAPSPAETPKWILDRAARWGKVRRDKNMRADIKVTKMR